MSALTLTLIPSYSRDELEMTAVLVRDGEEMKRYRYNSYITGWIELFLLFGMPFQISDDPLKDTMRNMARHLANDLKNDAILDTPANSSPPALRFVSR